MICDGCGKAIDGNKDYPWIVLQEVDCGRQYFHNLRCVAEYDRNLRKDFREARK